MASLHIRRFNSPMSLLLFLWNNIYFVFCTFKVSLFALNHECTCWSSLFIGYEPADLTVHPPRTAEGGFIFFCIGV